MKLSISNISVQYVLHTLRTMKPVMLGLTVTITIV